MVNYKELARDARLKVLEMVHKAQTSHIASNFSILDVATVLYENLKAEDAVVWSKGWAAASIYYFLNKQGKITDEQLATFPNPPFYGLAETSVPGVHVSGGSMGHGLPVAVGMALARKRAGQPGRIYCIMSDGELNEGTTWESAMIASQHDLHNLTVIIDKNGWQAMGKTSDVLDMGDLALKWAAFGFNQSTVDGHNFAQIGHSLGLFFAHTDKILQSINKPRVIIADTIKGKGVSFMEDHLLYHYAHVTAEDYSKAVAELSA